MSFLRVASAGLLVLGACSVEQTSSVEQQAAGGCDDWGCGSNSPEIDHLGIHDLHGYVGGTPNANGFQIVKIAKAWCAGCKPVQYKSIYSLKSNLIVEGTSGTLTGVDVLGTIVTVANATNKYEIRVTDLGRTSMWAHKTGGETTTTYLLEWDVVTTVGTKKEWKNVCKAPPSQDSPDLLNMNRYHSVVFEDDMIDAERKTVGTRIEERWWNVGCAGHALAKLHLTGHTKSADVLHGYGTTEQTRQTTLKMITAAYCETGHAFTVAGQPLGWLDQPTYNDYLPGFVGLKEAEWNETGVSCLNDPRVLANPTPLGSSTFPDLMDDIKAHCGGALPKPCADGDIYHLNGSHVISSNPS